MEGQVPTPEQLATGMRTLCDIINELITHGIPLWLVSDTAVPITASVDTYTFSPTGSVVVTKPMRVLQGYFLYTATGVRRSPLTVLSWNDYLSLGVGGTLNTGPINSYFVDKQQTNLTVKFWLCPDATEVAAGVPHVLLSTQATNPVNLTETINFPSEWRIALRWLLADDLSNGQPKVIMDNCSAKAQYYRKHLEEWDVEDAPTQFQVDSRMFSGQGKFR